MTIPVKGYAAHAKQDVLQPFNFERRKPRAQDVVIEILYTGVCHSDIHAIRGNWAGSRFPCVPGHEIVGRIIEVGKDVTRFKVNDVVGVGCLVDSCRECESCHEGLEHYCETGFTGTYCGVDKIGGTAYDITLGGYSEKITVDERFVLKIPANLDLAATAPLLCAGITTYSPLKHWKVGPNQKVGIIGLGGLGHMGVKFASAMGAEVVMITTSPEKGADAKKLGAHDVLISTDLEAMNAAKESFDFLLNTIPADHNFDPYVKLLKRNKTMVIVGAIGVLNSVNIASLAIRRRRVAGSILGGLPETQEMLDFCGKHNITSEIEKINIDKINEAYDRTVKGDVKYRFVIDMASLKE